MTNELLSQKRAESVVNYLAAQGIERERLSFSIAHCNFNLRGKESDGDKQFVSELAQKYQVQFWWKSFNTKPYSKKNKVSIQMAARDLRYEWMKRIAKEKHYDYIATAHHLDDSIETFFINLLRGTGITGLQGVPVNRV